MTLETSAPLPAVVGMVTTGTLAQGTLLRPSRSRIGFWLEKAMAAPRPAHRALPPPMATTASQPFSAMSLARASTSARSGSTGV